MPTDHNILFKAMSFKDYENENEKLKLSKMLTAGQNPAVIKIADEIAKARAAGDFQRVKDLESFGKVYDKGVATDETGNMVAMQGYGDAVSGIEGAKAGAK